MNEIALSEFNAIPTFFSRGVLSIEIDGVVYSKGAVYKMLVLMNLIDETR